VEPVNHGICELHWRKAIWRISGRIY